jgi:hypothetical protein
VTEAEIPSDVAPIMTAEELLKRIQNATPEMFRRAAEKFRFLTKRVERETVEARWRGHDILGGHRDSREHLEILKALRQAPNLGVDAELLCEAHQRRALARIDLGRLAVTKNQLTRAPRPLARIRTNRTVGAHRTART